MPPRSARPLRLLSLLGAFAAGAFLAGCGAQTDADPAGSGSEAVRGCNPAHHDRCPDLGSAPKVAADLATPPDLTAASPDLAVAPDLAPPPDLTQPADLAPAQAPAPGPTVNGVAPSTAPAGALLGVSGSGFLAGDKIVISGANLASTALVTQSLSATLIVGVLPALNVALPASLTVRVDRAGTDYPVAGLAFQLTQGHIYYISTTGNDSASGSSGSPWRTVAHAASTLAAGDLAYLRAGTYSEAVSFRGAGTASAPISLVAYPGEAPIVSGSGNDTLNFYGTYYIIDGLRVTNTGTGSGVAIASGSSHTTVQNCEVYNTQHQGIIIVGNYNLIYRNRIHDNGARPGLDHGIYDDGLGDIIRSNIVYNNFAHGMQLYNGFGTVLGNTLVEWNYVYNNGWRSSAAGYSTNVGLEVAEGMPNAIIRNNVFCYNAQYGLLANYAVPGTKITNNIFCYNGVGGISMLQPGTNNSIDHVISYNDASWSLGFDSPVPSNYNTVWVPGGTVKAEWNGSILGFATYQQTSGQDKNSVVADPHFTNVPANGFDPAAAQSYNFCNATLPDFCKSAP